MQGNSESFDHFVTKLRLLVKDCDYESYLPQIQQEWKKSSYITVQT